MSRYSFEWDLLKNEKNQRKHGISFTEAQTAFLDESAQEFFDPDHSAGEDRFVLLGMSADLKVVVVSFCVRRESIIRIISARKADAGEERDYQEYLK